MKIGVFGAGHLGKIHLKCIQMISGYDLVGFYDLDKKVSQEVSEQTGIQAFESAEALLDEVDVVDIVTPTASHFRLAKAAIEKGKHVFIEKPVTNTLEEAETLLALRNKHQVHVQVGHVERFNPAVSSVDLATLQPLFIEVHRLAPFNVRGTDVSVVLDLMIHDIDIILNIVPSEVKSIVANGVGVVSDTPDIANARIEFENGCVANLTASRISLKQMRKMRIFQPDAYVSLDFLEKQAQVIRISDQEPEGGYLSDLDTSQGKKYIRAEFPEIHPVNAIQRELETFLDGILNHKPSKVTLEDGYRALKVAYTISQEIQSRLQKIQDS